MTGYWQLKSNLNPIKCLQFGSKDDLGDWSIDLGEIVNLSFDPVREPRESDYEHILTMVKDGYTSGQYDSGVDY